MHLLTAETHREAQAWLPPMGPAVAAAARRRQARYEQEQAIASADPPAETVESAAARWLAEFDRFGVSAGVFLALGPRPETLRRFAAQQPDRLYAFSFVNPWEADAANVLEADVRQRGFRGLKLYPSIQGFHAQDERAYSVYERAEALGIPVLFHFGVTLDYRSDLRYSNPLDLHPVARDFPGVPFIVAHAGAGFLRETLFLAYHCANVFVDRPDPLRQRFASRLGRVPALAARGAAAGPGVAPGCGGRSAKDPGRKLGAPPQDPLVSAAEQGTPPIPPWAGQGHQGITSAQDR
jgi:predicted TIM-barrel fold metal-dependent hydrolase